MAFAFNSTTKQFLPAIDVLDPAVAGPEWLVASRPRGDAAVADFRALIAAGISPAEWITDGDRVREMTAEEKAAVQ